ncbi:SH3 domain-containing protein [Devosia sediminis]|uniref:SH3 domain-containing protein n=1 Tax=Devosia sediminis TaxID=2798801 RepID=A0A934IWS2_9HYPH|nr:SH3 domain-containing protein [Devosia sediminis]MBJ3783732.1 SH3 domain-containing protein [Devosia sediminis]
MRRELVFTIRAFVALALAALLAVLPAGAQDNRTVDVRFPRGASGTTVSDSITGYQSINYRIGVSAGQRMSVQLDTSNASNYFNITAPGASEALFNGSVSGNSTTFTIPSSGTYVVQVYLMRNAARRNESASFDLTLYVEGAAASTRPPVAAPAPVPDFADGLQGGPDYWSVEGLAGGDPLNIRSGPATSYEVIGTVHNGDRLRNFGCTMNGSTRWCQIETPRGQRGWVAGRYLHESFGQATTLPAVAPRPAPRPIVVPSSAAPDQLDMSQMPRFCAGEASAEYGIRPQYITTNIAFQSGNNYVVQGWFDGDGGTTFFNCYFSLDGRFVRLT